MSSITVKDIVRAARLLNAQPVPTDHRRMMPPLTGRMAKRIVTYIRRKK